MMKLKTLDDNPEWKDRFCNLPNPSGMDAAEVAKILELKYPVPSEAFFIETDTGEYCGRIFLHGSVQHKMVGHFGLYCLSGNPRYQEDFIKLWPEIEAWFTYYGISKVVGPFHFTTSFPQGFATSQETSKVDLNVFLRLGFSIEEKCTEYVLLSKDIAPV